MNKTEVSYKGIGFWGVLTVLFVALKLLGKITWSWIWVLCPLWGPTVLVLVLATIIIIVKEIMHGIKRSKRDS